MDNHAHTDCVVTPSHQTNYAKGGKGWTKLKNGDNEEDGEDIRMRSARRKKWR